MAGLEYIVASRFAEGRGVARYLIHRNVLKFGTVTGTVASATELVGRVARLAESAAGVVAD